MRMLVLTTISLSTEFEQQQQQSFYGNLSFLTTYVQNLKTLLQPFQRYEGNPKRKMGVI